MESVAGTPDVAAADPVEDDVYAVTRQAAYLLHEIKPLIVNWYAAQARNRNRILR
ncbi:hypothetical protein D9M69_49630 [compost metagenome]